MAPLLRRRLVCFYCGCRSAQVRKPDVRLWECEKCEAVNHLDEKGDITDPPATEASSSARYAQLTVQPSSPVFGVPEDPLFCPQCLKNQHLLLEALASYFPSPDVPNYAEYEKKFPEFRKGLEERYPQVCEKCEPRVRNRMVSTSYAAKTDHLRRLMEKTRDSGTQHRQLNWKNILIFLGGVGWSTSWTGQLVWDGLAILASIKEHEGLLDEDAPNSCSLYLQQIMKDSDIATDCIQLVDTAMRAALLLGLFSVWWNPRLQERLRKNGGRIAGIQEYYKLQVIFLALRFAVWAFMAGTLSSDLNRQTSQAIHSFMLVFGALSMLASFRSVQIDYTPPILFQDSPEPLVARNVQQSTACMDVREPRTTPRQLNSNTSQVYSSTQLFSIKDLGPPTQQTYQTLYQPPTPPPDEDHDEVMDWTPTQQPLRSTSSYRDSHLTPQLQPPDFRGYLSQSIVSPVHRLPNSVHQPISPTKKQMAFTFKTSNNRALQDADSVSDVGTEYEPSLVETLSPPKFVDPRFFPKSDFRAETGLESLFTSTFSLAEEPPEIRASHQRNGQSQSLDKNQKLLPKLYAQWSRALIVFLLVACYMFWTYIPKPSLLAYQQRFRFAALGTASLVTIRSLVVSMRKAKKRWSLSDLLLFGSELLALVSLGAILREPSTHPLSAARRRTLDMIGSMLMAVMVLQEIWMFCFEIWNGETKDIPPPSGPAAPNYESTSQKSDRQPPSYRTRDAFSENNPSSTAHSQLAPQLSNTSAQHSARSKTKVESSLGNGSGLGSLSLGGSTGNQQELGIGSRNPGRPRRRDRASMW